MCNSRNSLLIQVNEIACYIKVIHSFFNDVVSTESFGFNGKQLLDYILHHTIKIDVL